MTKRKLFGEYLLESGLITEGQLLDAVFEQIKDLPTWAEVIRSRGWMSESDLLRIFATQAKCNLDFRVAAKQCDLWNDELDQKVEAELQKIRSPIGHILIRKGLISLDRLSSALTNFGELSKALAEIPKPEATLIPFPEANASPVATDLPFIPEFCSIEGPVVGEYAELLNEDKRGEIEKTILQWESTQGEALEESLRNMYREYHTIKGSARFLKANLTEKLIHETEEILSLSTRFASRLNASDFERLTSVNLAVCDLIWELRDALSQTGSEESFWLAQETQQKYKAHFLKLMEFHKELEGRDYSVDLDALKDAF